MESQLESTELGAVALTHFFRAQRTRWPASHFSNGRAREEKTATPGGFTGGAQEKAHRFGGCSTTELSSLPTWAKSQERLGVLWRIQQKQTGYCNPHLVTPTSREDPDYSRAHDLLLATGREELQMEISEITTSSSLSKDRRV